MLALLYYFVWIKHRAVPIQFIKQVIQFCNGNCSVTKVVIPSRKREQEHVKSTNNMYKNMIET